MDGVYICMDGWMYACVPMVGWVDGWMDGLMYGWMGGWILVW